MYGERPMTINYLEVEVAESGDLALPLPTSAAREFRVEVGVGGVFFTGFLFLFSSLSTIALEYSLICFRVGTSASSITSTK